jgi:hypothetical protein
VESPHTRTPYARRFPTTLSFPFARSDTVAFVRSSLDFLPAAATAIDDEPFRCHRPISAAPPVPRCRSTHFLVAFGMRPQVPDETLN